MAYRMIFQELPGVKERVHSIINASVFIAYLYISCHCLCRADPCLCFPHVKAHSIHLLVHEAIVRVTGWNVWASANFLLLIYPILTLVSVTFITWTESLVPFELAEKLALLVRLESDIHFRFKRIYLKVFSRTHHLGTICPPHPHPRKSETRGGERPAKPLKSKSSVFENS